jgi:hypothetical protein
VAGVVSLFVRARKGENHASSYQKEQRPATSTTAACIAVRR